MLGIFSFLGFGGVALLSGATGLSVLLLKGSPAWRLYKVALGALFGSVASIGGFLAGDPRALLLGGLPVVAVMSALIANSLWGRTRLRLLPSTLDEDGKREAVERIGRRLWFPLITVIAVPAVLMLLPFLGITLWIF